MTDIIDQAQQTESLNLAHALHAHACIAARTVRPAAAGHCLNRDCLDTFEDGSARLYCGPRCAELHDRQMKHQSR